MADTIDITTFRGRFPEFSDTSKYPDAQVQFYLDLSQMLMAADRWQNLLPFGAFLFTAHNLTLEAVAVRDSARGSIPGAIMGAQTAGSVDKVSWSRDASAAMNPGAGHWNLSTYGLRYRQLVMMVGAGPVYVGAPTTLELSQTPFAWPGPYSMPNPSN